MEAKKIVAKVLGELINVTLGKNGDIKWIEKITNEEVLEHI